MEMIYNPETLRHQLDALVSQWSELILGSPDGKQKARGLYDEYIFPVVRELFTEAYKELLKPPVYGLVLLVGHSPDALILSASAIGPKRILFLHSSDTERHVEKVVNALGLHAIDYERRQVEKSDPISVYIEIRRAYRQWRDCGAIAVDITGGTKCMSAAAAMAGHAIGAMLVYVDSQEYLPGTRSPLPGSEYLRVVQDPYHVLGDLKDEEAHGLFKRHDFRGAERIVSELRNVSLEPRRHEVLSDYLRACDAWDSLDFGGAASLLMSVIDKLKRFPESTIHLGTLYRSSPLLQSQATVTAHLASKLSAQQGALGVGLLQDRDAMSTLLFTMYACAERRADRCFRQSENAENDH